MGSRESILDIFTVFFAKETCEIVSLNILAFAFAHPIVCLAFVYPSRFSEEVLAPIREYNALEVRRKSLVCAHDICYPGSPPVLRSGLGLTDVFS